MAEKLYEKLCNYDKKNIVPMHMPGHKRSFGFGNQFDILYKMDITEIDGFDNLHHPTEIIDELQKKMAQIYETKQSFMLVNGSSGGVLAAISAAAHQSIYKKIIIARNCHKSVYNAVFLNNLEVVYTYPELDEKMGIWGKINVLEIEELIKENDVCGIVITSPTYEGIISDIEKISEIAHRKNIPLIVDSAHGAHFKFHNIFPKTAIESGADIVIESLHKTLPALTQTAVLHIGNGSLINLENILRFIDIYQSTSPSYILMASISKCMEFVQEQKKQFDIFAERIVEFRNKISELKNLFLYSVDDLSKIVIYSPYLNGSEIYDILLKEYKIQLEMASQKYVIAMTSVCDSQENFDRFFEALQAIDNSINIAPNECISWKNEKLKIAMNFTDAFSSEKELIDLENCAGRISHEHIIAYPPGCPVVAAGEVISQTSINTIKKYIELGIEIIGVDDNKIRVVR